DVCSSDLVARRVFLFLWKFFPKGRPTSMVAKVKSRSGRRAVEFPVNKKGELQVSLRAIADLVPAARNARTHSEVQIEVICASLKEFGWTNPVLISGKNEIVAGHGRVLAARK